MKTDKKKGSTFYDNADTFDKYVQHRQKLNNPNELIEKPIIKALTDQIEGNILDLGCGYGDLAEFYLAQGGHSYLGLDASKKMIELGHSLISHPNIQLIHADIETWEFPSLNYDWVISRLVLHYIQDLAFIFQKIHQSLKQDGTFLFSVEHPVLTSSMHLLRPKGKKQNWVVDEYFNIGARQQHWMENLVVKYHRTLEEYWRLLNENGFQIVDIREGCPQSSFFESAEEYERRRRIPLFLIIKSVKITK